MAEAAKLRIGDKELDLPMLEGSEQERALDISALRSQTGFITLDEGYVNTGATTSAITYLDGEKGILRYRGYPIEELAARCDFVETSYLLIHGELPTPEQLHEFRMSIRRHTMLHEDMRSFYNGFPRDAHPMAILSSVVGGLSTFYQDSLDPLDMEQAEISTARLLAKLPTIAAYSYIRSRWGSLFNYPTQRPLLLRKLPADDVRRSLRALRDRPRLRRGLESAADRARRSRAELQHQHGADGGIVQRELVCFDCRRNLRSLGPACTEGQMKPA